MKKNTKLKLENSIGLYAASMGKIFSVTHIADSTEDANSIMEKNPDIGMISQDQAGHIFLANLYGAVCPSAILDDMKGRRVKSSPSQEKIDRRDLNRLLTMILQINEDHVTPSQQVELGAGLVAEMKSLATHLSKMQ